MRFLLDTQLVLWWFTHPGRLPAAARNLVEETDDEVYVSRASLWEMAIKVGSIRLRIKFGIKAYTLHPQYFVFL